MAALPAGSVDMIFADPPYNLRLKGELRRPNNSRVDGVEDAWDKFGDFADYDRFTRDWLTAARRALKPDGTIWVIGTYHNIFRLGSALQDLGFWVLNDVIWRKTNPMPNFRGRRFTNAHETLIWAARDEASRYTFNYGAMKSLNDELQMRSDWLIPVCGGAERLKRDGKQGPSDAEARGAAASRACWPRPSRARSCSIPSSAPARPAPWRNFSAVASSASSAIPAMRRSRGSGSRGSCRSAIPTLVATPSKREEPRIPFGWLVERGMLRPGQVLTDQSGRWTARVRADGTLISAEHKGSIHQVGAAVQSAPACNGWTFWWTTVEGSRVPIDLFRQKLRAELN